MKLSELMHEINVIKPVPVDAIRELIARKDESTSILLGCVKDVLDTYKTFDGSRDDYIVALYILSYLREPAAFPYVIEYALLPADWLGKVLGDYLTEGLTQWIVSTYNGDLQMIKKVIENETAEFFARYAALDSLIGLVAIGVLSRDDAIQYLKNLIDSALILDYEFASAVVSVANCLYPEELYQEIINLFDRNLIDAFFIDKEQIEDAIKMGKERCMHERVFTVEYNLPVTDVIECISEKKIDIDQKLFERVDDELVY